MEKQLPKIALIGRPNVGKSALFNRIAKKRIAVVHEEEGVTRDRLYASCECFGKEFELIDTGGIDFKGEIPFYEEVRLQAEIAITEADVIILVVDGTVGVTPQDEEVVKSLREAKKPILLAVNKIDTKERQNLLLDFYQLGLGEPLAVSATQGYKVAELLETALSHCEERFEEEIKSIKIALIGRPNVGKSTFLNALIGENRSIVSDIAGTTRDSIDAHIEYEGEHYTLIDTAGIRRKFKEKAVVEKFAAMRTASAISRADICVLMLDAEEGLSAQDKKIANEIEAQGKGCVILFNKWDKVKGIRMEHCAQVLAKDASFLAHCPTLFISALNGRNTQKIFEICKRVYHEMRRRITTGQLNKFVEKTMQLYHPPMIKGKRLRIYYLTQVRVDPPRFVLFVNHKNLMLETYRRYLLNAFRKTYAFEGCPVLLELRARSQRDDISTYVASKS